MANPGGGNQFGSYQLQPQYGDVKKQTQLIKEAPISGAPYAAQALNAPRRNQRKATRGTSQAQTPGPAARPPQPQPSSLATPQTVAETWSAIAAIPGAPPVIGQVAQEAQAAAQGFAR